MVGDGARARRSIRHQHRTAKQARNQPGDLVRGTHEVDHRCEATGHRERRIQFFAVQQRLAGVLGAGQCRRRALEAIPITRHPAMEPSFQRGFNGGPIDRIDLDELEQSLPVVTPLDGATSMGMVEQGPQRHEFSLDGLELSLMLHHRLAGHIEAGVGLAHTFLDDRCPGVDVTQLAIRGLDVAASPLELVGQRALPDRPGFQLRAQLLLLFAEKLQPPFQLAKLGVDRDAFALEFLSPLLRGGALSLDPGLCLARGTLAVRRGLECRIRGPELNPGGLNSAGELIDDAAAGPLRGRQLRQLPLQRFEGLDRRRVPLLGDPRLMLTLCQAKPNIRHGFLMTPARLAGGQQRRPVLRVARLELADRLSHRGALVLRRVHAGLGAAQLHHRLPPGIPCQAALQHLQGIGHFLVFVGRHRLHAELFSPRTELVEDVAGPPHVAVRLGQPVQRLLTLIAKPAHAGGLLDELAAQRRHSLDDEIDVVLRRDGVTVLAQPGAGQQRIDVFQAGARAVDQVLALARTEEAAGNLDFRELHVESLVRVVDGEGDLGHADRGFARPA